jgi:hexosaminidase
MVLDHNVTLRNDTVVMYVVPRVFIMMPILELHRVWESSSDASSVANKNFRLVHAPSDYFYLVCPLPANSTPHI